MKRTAKQSALIAFILLQTAGIKAQPDYPKYEFGINLGFLVYQGDLTPRRWGSFETQKFSLGLHASKFLSPSLSVRANLQWGKLKGDDAKYSSPEYRQQRNFNFTSPVTELSAQLVWDIRRKNYDDRGLSPYLFAGAGVSLVKINRDWSTLNTEYFSPESSGLLTGLAEDQAHKLPRILPVIPVGAGVKYFLTPKLAINAEASYRLASTDYLDGFSRAANPERKDNYLNYSIGFIYRKAAKNKLGCPVLKY
jgi:opacity protein-like surface antigen